MKMTEITLFNKGVEVKKINVMFPELVYEQPRVLHIDGTTFIISPVKNREYHLVKTMAITNVNLDRSLLQ